MKSNIPLVDLKTQYLELRGHIEASLDTVLSDAQFVLGPQVDEFETAVARFAGARHAISVANGTDALKIALLAEGIGPGDAVFLPSFTFVASAEVVVSIGATPVFIDIDEQTFTMDPTHLSHRIDETVQQGHMRPRAIMPVDLFGLPADYPAINTIADRYGLFVLADAAQSLGGSINQRRVGGLAQVTATSFYPSKPLGCYGDGGCIFTDDNNGADRIRLLRGHGLEPNTGKAVCVGLNSRLDTLQAAILLSKLEAFETELAARDTIAGWYASRLKALETAKHPDGYSSAWAVYSILVNNRDQVRSALAEDGIATAVYYSTPLHLQPAYKRYGEGLGSLPVSERICQHIFAVPMSAYVTEETVERICLTITQSAD